MPNLTRRAVAAGLAVIPAALVATPGVAETVEQDATFALIERHRAAEAAMSAALDDGGAPEHVYDALWAEQSKAYEDLLNCTPTTVAGVLALASHALESERQRSAEEEGHAVGALAAVVRGLRAGRTHGIP